MSASSKTTHPALYRVAQFFAAVKAMLLTPGELNPADEALVNSTLITPSQQRLFARMSPNDQRHALAVGRTLQQAGYNQSPLLQAALLHDVAKSLGQPILHRVAIVLLEAFWPSALERVSAWPQSVANGREAGQAKIEGFSIHSFAYSPIPLWRRPFVIHAHHPAIGAVWAEETCCDPLAVRLIARHQETGSGQAGGDEDKLLAALQWADDLN